LEDLGIDGNIIIIMYLRGVGWEGVGWVLLAQDMDQWQVLVNMIMNPRGISWLDERLLDFQKGHRSLEIVNLQLTKKLPNSKKQSPCGEISCVSASQETPSSFLM
jgi:hypothetical protein